MTTSPHQILIVEDEEHVRNLLVTALASNGYQAASAADADQAMALSRTQDFDVAIVDIKMPGMDGIELSRSLRAGKPDLPVILITAHADVETARQAIRLGAYDYIAKPFDMDDVVLSVARAAERRALLSDNRVYQQELESKVEERTHQLYDAMRRLEGSFLEIRQAHLESVFILSRVTELNDEYTGNHIRRVSCYCEEVARGLGCDAQFIEQIVYSSPMHDIGKISVPSGILSKPGKLTPDEFEVVKQHAVNGARILEGIPFLVMAREIALTHHERYNGTGYPSGLKGEDIPLSGRIVAVADVFDALMSRRPYKKPYSFEDSIDIMSRETGKHFDPQVLGVFLGLADRIREIAVGLSDENGHVAAGAEAACHALALRYVEAGGGAGGVGSAKSLASQHRWTKGSTVAKLMEALVKAAPEAARFEKGKASAAAKFSEFRAWHALLKPLFDIEPPEWKEKKPPQAELVFAQQQPVEVGESPEVEKSDKT